jgi:GNAT superfamily N-acetyltransferase
MVMDQETPQIEVRAVDANDATVISHLEYNFETDRIYTLRVKERFSHTRSGEEELPNFAFELLETPVDRPLYKNYFADVSSVEEIKTRLRDMDGGYVALADGQIAGAILFKVEKWRSVTLISDLIVGHQYRRYGIGTLLLNCAIDWAREHSCWAIVLETQNINYPAIQFYLRNGLEIWSISRHFYPPGNNAHEVAVFMGKRLSATPEP